MIYQPDILFGKKFDGSVFVSQPPMKVTKVKDIVDDGSMGFAECGPGVDVFLEDGTKRHGDGENGGGACTSWNRRMPEYRRQWKYWRLKATLSVRPKSVFPGRFGGGWNWKIGVQWGSNCVLVSLLIAELRIET